MKSVFIKNPLQYDVDNPIMKLGYGKVSVTVYNVLSDTVMEIYHPIVLALRRDISIRKSISYKQLIINKLRSAAGKIIGLIIK